VRLKSRNAGNQSVRWAKSVQRLVLAGEVCLTIASWLLQTCLAASVQTLKYSGDFWVGVYLHRTRQIWDEGNEYDNIHKEVSIVF